MTQTKRRTLQNLQTFIHKGLPDKLRRDLEKLRIIKEADLECAAYYHLRRYVGENSAWRVLARRNAPTGYVVDLLIFKDFCPEIAIELKWDQVNIEQKDRGSLHDALTKLGVHKAYWLSTVYSDKPQHRFVKETDEKGVLHLIVVPLGLSGPKLEQWKEHRRRFWIEMAPGRGRRIAQSG